MERIHSNGKTYYTVALSFQQSPPRANRIEGPQSEVLALDIQEDMLERVRAKTQTLTDVIFDPHFQGRETLLRAAEATGFKERKTSWASDWPIPCTSRSPLAWS